jgi:hypothetical protein
VAERLFTIEEVNELIPKLESILVRMQRRGSELREAVRAAMGDQGEGGQVSVGELLRMHPEVEPMAREIESLLAEIEDTGGQFKGLDLGLIDFPAELDGEIVLLCWQYGESEVGFYHTMEAGFAGRKPLPRTRPRLLQ